MSFSFDPAKNQAAATPASNAATPAPMTGFTFGTSGGGDTGKPLASGFPTMSTPAQAKPSGLFGTGLTNTPQANAFTFGTPNAAAPATLGPPMSAGQTPGLTFGTSTPSTGISFNTTNAAPSTGFAASTGGTTGFNLGSATVTTAGATTGLSFGTPKTGAATGFSLGGGENVPTPAPQSAALGFGTPSTMSSGFGLGSTLGTPGTTTTATTTTATSFNVGGATTTTTSTAGLSMDLTKRSNMQTGFNLVPSTASFQASTGFGATTTAPTTSATFSLGAPASTAATSFSFGGGTTTVTTAGFTLGKSTSTAAPTSLTATTTAALGTTTTVSSSASTQLGAINFCQLEESINKWTLELEEQEKVFVNQATQVNAWDKLLITNGEKIVTLNQEVERVKIEQQQLEHELDYVVGQQKELQDCLVPLEKELASLSVSDPEREYTYRLAENLDTQLKQMSEDLKEIIEHLNEANRTQDSSDPIVQIGKILNAHMNSLQWLDQRTALLSQKIQQIDQMHQNFRQENERSFNLAYN